MTSTALTAAPQTAQAVASPMDLYSREKIDTIKNTVAKGATDAELFMFLELAGRYGLDPFAKEIWCHKYVKQGQNPLEVSATIMVSRDGYLKAAQQHPDFEGLKSFVVKEGDQFEIDPMADTLVHKFGAKRGKILGAWAICYRKGRKPVMCFVDFDEYKGTSPIWNNYPSAMIQKVAEVFVLKRQFGINGLVSREELDYQMNDEGFNGVTIEAPKVDLLTGEVKGHPAALPPAAADAEVMITKAQKDTILLEWGRLFPGFQETGTKANENAQFHLATETGKDKRDDLTKAEAAEYITLLQSTPVNA